jgi:hypothetical protein
MNLKRAKAESIANLPIDSLQSGIYYGGVDEESFLLCGSGNIFILDFLQ